MVNQITPTPQEATVTRGIRNNNPGNIRLGQQWQGLATPQNDPSFCQFISPEYGVRAIAVIIRTYHTEGFTTITQIITRWAPTVENDTQAYIEEVCSVSGFSPAKVIDSDDIDDLLGLIKGIIMEENGTIPYSDQQIEDGINLALI